MEKRWFLKLGLARFSMANASAVIFWCSFAGIGAPLIVPPIRNAMNRPEVVTPPKLADVRLSLQFTTSLFSNFISKSSNGYNELLSILVGF